MRFLTAELKCTVDVQSLANRLPIAHQHANGHRRNPITRPNKKICNVVPIVIADACESSSSEALGSFHDPYFMRENY